MMMMAIIINQKLSHFLIQGPPGGGPPGPGTPIMPSPQGEFFFKFRI